MARPTRAALLLLALPPLLPGCGDPGLAAGVTAAVTVGSIATIGRTPGDAVVSLITGRDCSVVRVDRRQTYCAAPEPPPPPTPFCTRSLGAVDCWTQPPLAIPPQRGVADGPMTLSPAQDADRTARWPKLF